MKKRLAIFILTLALTVTLLPRTPVEADSSHLIYVSVNDRLLQGYWPYFYGSSLYLPLDVFQEIGITYTADVAASTFIIKYGGAELIFNLQNGESYDSSGESYGAKAIYVAGSVYLPAYSVSSYFGITATYINGTGNGDVIRLKTGSATYSDIAFLEVATPTLERETKAYYAAGTTPGSSAAPPPTPTPPPSPTPTPDRSETLLTISFAGAPTPEILDILEEYGLPAIFFLTAEDVQASPSTLRRAVGTGHRLGVWITGEEDSPRETAELVYEAARVRAAFVSSPSELAEVAERLALEESLIYAAADFALGPDSDGFDPAPLLGVSGRAALRLDAASPGLLLELLEFIGTYKFTVEPTLETLTRIITEQDG